jgi:hypothetical protein
MRTQGIRRLSLHSSKVRASVDTNITDVWFMCCVMM